MYDIENRTVTWDGAESYGYAPDNRRVWRRYVAAGITYEDYTLRGLNGKPLGTYRLFWDDNEGQGPWVLRWSMAGTGTEQVWFGTKEVKAPWMQPIVHDRLGTGTQGIGHYPYGEVKSFGGGGGVGGDWATYPGDGTGLRYADQRYYHPAWGRFTTPDPSQGTPMALSQYTYGGGDPVNQVDAKGLNACSAEYSFEDCFGFGGPMWHGFLPGESPYRCWEMILSMTSSSSIGALMWDSVCSPYMVSGAALYLAAQAKMKSSEEKKKVTHLLITSDCWMLKNPKTNAPSRNTTFVAYDGNTSLEGDPDVMIQESVTHPNGTLATDIISDPRSTGGNGVFRDQKGLGFLQVGIADLYQSFTVSVSGTRPYSVDVKYSNQTQSWGTLGVYMTAEWVDGVKDYNVFVTGGLGKDSIPLCP